VLIITNEMDAHADAVVLELRKRDIPVFRFHPDDFPHACSISIEVANDHVDGRIVTPQRSVSFADIGAAWYRRPHNPVAPTSITKPGELADYIRLQRIDALETLYTTLDTLWVGHPARLRRADVKALQLAEASKAGLQTPHTLISNEPAAVGAFVDALGDAECAIKPLNLAGVGDQRAFRFPLTTTLPKSHPLDSAAVAPSIYQPYIRKAAELRCVVIGDQVFSAKIDSQANELTSKDWRAGDNRYEPFALPEPIKAAIHRLMDRFGINFASLDMILTPEGEFVFLELNPNGQWLWIETELGFPLVRSLVDLLTGARPTSSCVVTGSEERRAVAWA